MTMGNQTDSMQHSPDDAHSLSASSYHTAHENDDLDENTEPHVIIDIPDSYQSQSSISMKSTMCSSKNTPSHAPKWTLSRFMRTVKDTLIKCCLGCDTHIWTLEDQMSRFTLVFFDEKIEASYIWHTNKRFV